jgi:ribosome-binding protein aMBF1 (putative translation factor)
MNRIEIILRDRGVKKRWLAEKLEKHPNTISRWCKNEYQPTLKEIKMISQLLNVTADDLIAEDVK